MLQIKTVKSFNLSAKPLLALFSAWTLYYLILYIAGLDLISEHLISDAKFYVLSAEKLADYKISAQFNVYIEGKTFTERYLLLVFLFISILQNSDRNFKPLVIESPILYSYSQFFTLQNMLFTRRPCFIGKFIIIDRDTHIGGTTFGMRGFGFLPRDLVSQ